MCVTTSARDVTVSWNPCNVLSFKHYATFLCVLGLDQSSKYCILTLSDHLPYSLTSWCTIVLLWNPGVVFGITLFNHPLAYVAMTVGISLCVLYMICRTPCSRERMGFILILAGAVGNIIDRIRFAAVVDFIDLHVHNYHWPAFNIADAAISCTVAWLCLKFLKSPL